MARAHADDRHGGSSKVRSTEMTKPKTPTFTEQHLPRMLNWKDNLPKFGVPAPIVTLGPPSSALKDETLLDAYFKGSVMAIELDMQRRPDHYTQEQKDLVEILKKKEPLPPGVGNREINDLVMHFVETSKQKEMRRQVIQKAQKKLEEDEDPTVERKNKEDKERHLSFEDQADAKESAFIKII